MLEESTGGMENSTKTGQVTRFHTQVIPELTLSKKRLG
jgi:hypothetical protein